MNESMRESTSRLSDAYDFISAHMTLQHSFAGKKRSW